MSTLIRLAGAFIVAVTLAGCNFVGAMSEIQSQANAAASALEKDLGVRPLVGWNWNNGALTNVNFVFEGSKVAHLQVSQLKAKVEQAVAANFKQKPYGITISTSWKQ